VTTVTEPVEAGPLPAKPWSGGGREELAAAVRRLTVLTVTATAPPDVLAAAADLLYPTCEQRPTRLGALQDNWAKQLEKLAVHGNQRAAFARNSVYHLMAPPRRLLLTALLLAAVNAGLRGYGPASPRPAALPD